MDPGTAQVLTAIVAGVFSTVTLVLNVFVLRRTTETHALVNGLAHETQAAVASAALKEGELRARDYMTDPRTVIAQPTESEPPA